MKEYFNGLIELLTSNPSLIRKEKTNVQAGISLLFILGAALTTVLIHYLFSKRSGAFITGFSSVSFVALISLVSLSLLAFFSKQKPRFVDLVRISSYICLVLPVIALLSRIPYLPLLFELMWIFLISYLAATRIMRLPRLPCRLIFCILFLTAASFCLVLEAEIRKENRILEKLKRPYVN